MEPSATITSLPGPQQSVYSQSSGSKSKLLSGKPGIHAKLAFHVTCQPILFTYLSWLFSQFPINWILASKSKLLTHFSIVFSDVAVIQSHIAILQSHISFLQSYISFLQPFLAVLLTHLSILFS